MTVIMSGHKVTYYCTSYLSPYAIVSIRDVCFRSSGFCSDRDNFSKDGTVNSSDLLRAGLVADNQ
jgi:hypothetical protein